MLESQKEHYRVVHQACRGALHAIFEDVGSIIGKKAHVVKNKAARSEALGPSS